MNIGIIGYGKMGKEIFSLLSEKLNDARITVIVRHNAEEYSKEYLKTLSKSLKRGRIKEDQYLYRSENTFFLQDISSLAECDAVIESVSEDLVTKNDLFRQLDSIISEHCLLLTNTSSLDISAVFNGVSNPERCLGMHFFYPVKLSGYIELNAISENTPENIEAAKRIAGQTGKTPLVFRGEMHMFLNQILACIVSHGIYLCEYLEVSPAELEKALSALFPAAGIFEIMDSIGIGLMAKSTDNFKSQKNRQLFSYGKNRMEKWLSEGCPSISGGFLEFIATHSSKTGNDSSSAELYMVSLLINELNHAISNYDGDRSDLISAVKDITGIAEDPDHYIDKYGYSKLISALDELYRATGSPAYKNTFDNV